MLPPQHRCERVEQISCMLQLLTAQKRGEQVAYVPPASVACTACMYCLVYYTVGLLRLHQGVYITQKDMTTDAGTHGSGGVFVV